ncbi:MAG: nucleoside monophosphate kinase [Acidobacteriota bacterium]|nr:nucleoside monophosphate kinase [Acidobacteriota bacterium]
MHLRRKFVALAIGLLWVGTVTAQPKDMRFVIVLIGPPGSGKTTQSEFLKKTFGTPTITVEDLIRSHPAALAKYETDGIRPGTPQSNPALNDLVRDALSGLDLTKGVVLDGYPASKDQADHLAALVRKLGLPSPVVIQLDISDDLARERLKVRGRADDNPEVIARRLKDYHRELETIRSYYPQANIWTVDGSLAPAQVSQTIQSILKDEIPKKL